VIGLLIRHGHGNADGVDRLCRALEWMPLTAVYSSPLERAVGTARPLARDHGLEVRLRPALTDVYAGGVRGRSADEPSLATLRAAQQRIVDELVTLAITHPGETVAIVTHAEPIRCALAAFGGTTFDAMTAADITPVHVSTVGIAPRLRRVLGINLPADQLLV
jgi:probable phosphoglycerate mutase